MIRQAKNAESGCDYPTLNALADMDLPAEQYPALAQIIFALNSKTVHNFGCSYGFAHENGNKNVSFDDFNLSRVGRVPFTLENQKCNREETNFNHVGSSVFLVEVGQPLFSTSDHVPHLKHRSSDGRDLHEWGFKHQNTQSSDSNYPGLGLIQALGMLPHNNNPDPSSNETSEKRKAALIELQRKNAGDDDLSMSRIGSVPFAAAYTTDDLTPNAAVNPPVAVCTTPVPPHSMAVVAAATVTESCDDGQLTEGSFSSLMSERFGQFPALHFIWTMGVSSSGFPDLHAVLKVILGPGTSEELGIVTVEGDERIGMSTNSVDSMEEPLSSPRNGSRISGISSATHGERRAESDGKAIANDIEEIKSYLDDVDRLSNQSFEGPTKIIVPGNNSNVNGSEAKFDWALVSQDSLDSTIITVDHVDYQVKFAVVCQRIVRGFLARRRYARLLLQRGREQLRSQEKSSSLAISHQPPLAELHKVEFDSRKSSRHLPAQNTAKCTEITANKLASAKTIYSKTEALIAAEKLISAIPLSFQALENVTIVKSLSAAMSETSSAASSSSSTPRPLTPKPRPDGSSSIPSSPRPNTSYKQLAEFCPIEEDDDEDADAPPIAAVKRLTFLSDVGAPLDNLMEGDEEAERSPVDEGHARTLDRRSSLSDDSELDTHPTAAADLSTSYDAGDTPSHGQDQSLSTREYLTTPDDNVKDDNRDILPSPIDDNEEDAVGLVDQDIQQLSNVDSDDEDAVVNQDAQQPLDMVQTQDMGQGQGVKQPYDLEARNDAGSNQTRLLEESVTAAVEEQETGSDRSLPPDLNLVNHEEDSTNNRDTNQNVHPMTEGHDDSWIPVNNDRRRSVGVRDLRGLCDEHREVGDHVEPGRARKKSGPTRRQSDAHRTRNSAARTIQRIYRGHMGRLLARLRKSKLACVDSYSCRNCGRVVLGGDYCKGCGRRNSVPASVTVARLGGAVQISSDEDTQKPRTEKSKQSGPVNKQIKRNRDRKEKSAGSSVTNIPEVKISRERLKILTELQAVIALGQEAMETRNDMHPTRISLAPSFQTARAVERQLRYRDSSKAHQSFNVGSEPYISSSSDKTPLAASAVSKDVKVEKHGGDVSPYSKKAKGLKNSLAESPSIPPNQSKIYRRQQQRQQQQLQQQQQSLEEVIQEVMEDDSLDAHFVLKEEPHRNSNKKVRRRRALVGHDDDGNTNPDNEAGTVIDQFPGGTSYDDASGAVEVLVERPILSYLEEYDRRVATKNLNRRRDPRGRPPAPLPLGPPIASHQSVGPLLPLGPLPSIDSLRRPSVQEDSSDDNYSHVEDTLTYLGGYQQAHFQNMHESKSLAGGTVLPALIQRSVSDFTSARPTPTATRFPSLPCLSIDTRDRGGGRGRGVTEGVRGGAARVTAAPIKRSESKTNPQKIPKGKR